MNKTKRNLILASAIVNLIGAVAFFVLELLVYFRVPFIMNNFQYFRILDFSSLSDVRSTIELVYCIFSFVVGVVGSILLIWSVRKKGKFFRTSQGFYIAGLIIVVISGGLMAWILLFISMFIPDVIVINSRSELRREEREEEKQTIRNDAAYEEKKKRIEDLKRMRDNGIITEEEYKQKLFELL